MNNIVFIAHRINTIKELIQVPIQYGVEVDIRDYGNELILRHDPYGKEGVEFDEYLKHFQHSFIILNIKSEGIEWKVLDLLKKYNIKKYFFLDSSFPMIYKLLQKGENNIAIRYSEYEGLDTLRKLKNNSLFLWVDCFNEFPLTICDFNEIQDMQIKICYVSPELQNQPDRIIEYKKLIQEKNIIPNMICTKLKNIKEWCI